MSCGEDKGSIHCLSPEYKTDGPREDKRLVEGTLLVCEGVFDSVPGKYDQSRPDMAGSRGLGLLMAIVFISEEMAGVSPPKMCI